MDQRRSDRHTNFLIRELLSHEAVEQAQLLDAAKQAQHHHVPLMFYLVQNELIKPKVAAHILSEIFELNLYDLTVHDESLIPRSFLNFDYVKKFYGIPIFKRGDNLTIAIAEPNIIELRDIGFLTCHNIEFVLAEIDQLRNVIDKALMERKSDAEQDEHEKQNESKTAEFLSDISGDLGSEFDDFEVSSLEAETETELLTSDDLNDTPVVRFVNKILVDAIRSNSSDIHFEPYEKYCRVRYRQDGVLKEIINAPKKLTNSIVARLKVMANLDISEHRVPQDGRFRLTISKGTHIDIRISTCPTVYGEKIVMRILDSGDKPLDITDLGMDDFQKKHFLRVIQQPQGLILVTGPTGSGKTVSLYTALGILNTPEKNISTVEDPVEIYMHGINQVQINLKAGMTFAGALRSFLRQDPDIIMVGEIRDLETAEISIKAAQTGHLVLSTLHTNNAALTLSRLSSMGVKSYNISSAVSLVMAQRLLRRLCSYCKKPVDNKDELLAKFELNPDDYKDCDLFKPGLCSRCTAGYKGRIGIFEVMPITPEINTIIMNEGNADELEAAAKKEGMLTLRESALKKFKEGMTSLEEVNRVTLY